MLAAHVGQDIEDIMEQADAGSQEARDILTGMFERELAGIAYTDDEAEYGDE